MQPDETADTNPPGTNLHGLWVCLAAVVCSLLAPGAGHLVIRANTRRWGLIVATGSGIVGNALLLWVIATSRSHGSLAALAADIVADRARFLALAAALIVLAVTRLWTAAEVAWLARPEHSAWRTVVAATTAATLILGGVTPLVVAAGYVWRTDRAVERVFGSGDAQTAQPGTLPPHTDPGTGSLPESSSTTSTTSPPFPGADRVNVLLLGGDAGKGRWSLRTDSMILVSIDPETGDTAMISVPRNLTQLPFPPGTPLAEQFPRGFTDLANAVYPYVHSRPALAGGGADAGAQAIKLGIAQLLGVPIQYYVLVDMGGFISVVDALGGIDVTITKRVPAPGNPSEAKHTVPKWFEKGTQHLDGTLALSYARSRHADSDYQRMGRQRCVLAGIAAAATPKALATGLGALVDAFGDSVRTDIPRERLPEFVQLIERYAAAGGQDAVRTLLLTPPVIIPNRWDAAHVRELVATLLTTPPYPTTIGGIPPLGEQLTAECTVT